MDGKELIIGALVVVFLVVVGAGISVLFTIRDSIDSVGRSADLYKKRKESK